MEVGDASNVQWHYLSGPTIASVVCKGFTNSGVGLLEVGR